MLNSLWDSEINFSDFLDYSWGLGAKFYSFTVLYLFLSSAQCCLGGRRANPTSICYLIVNAKHKVMLLVFHVRLTLLVNMGPRVHFVTVLHDSSVQSGSGEICRVFLRRETKHLRPLSGEYLSSWHCSWVA